MSNSYSTYYNSPIGKIEITGTNNSIKTLSFISDDSHSNQETNQYLEQFLIQINEYFTGTRKEFELNLDPEGTDFQKKVWKELLKIPYGKTKSYLWQSKMIGDQLAIRSVASANGQNKIPIIIPCHRVIGNDGRLTGYAGGLWRKKIASRP
ncbi:MAG: methylated-DNA--[protein]-cysteine S-methyltransferase [Ignavibacteriales bacterium]|nr:methylated-DNA--[protein]-cysteine S-methyltransferase [Ignavibacteriales bacterium]